MFANTCKFNDIITALNDSPYEFYWSGSMFFNGNGYDLDLFAQYSGDIVNFLLSLGFKICDDIGDSNMKVLYRHTYPQIDIQLVKDAVKKNCVQESLSNNMELYDANKKERSHTWNLAYKVYDHIHNTKSEK